MRRRTAIGLVTALGLVPSVTVGLGSAATAQTPDLSQVGAFGAPFEEKGAKCVKDKTGRSICKPAAATSVVLANGKILYWDALEGSEDTQIGQGFEYGEEAQNDRSRVLTLGPKPSWAVPTPEDGGANPDGYRNPTFPSDRNDPRNDGSLFCSDQVFLADGRVLVAGGTAYYNDPDVSGTPYGFVELEGIPNTRIFNPADNRWTQAANMNFGRWYPSLVTLPNGKIFVASGVTKLFKPVYPDRPADSGTNVKQTETFDPKTGKWTVNPGSASKSLPLYPRLHLLPNGKVYYDAAGQTFNPAGQSYDEATWNMTSVYDPDKQTWTDLGLPVVGALRGFRGSSFSTMLPLTAPYTSASFLSAGGVIGTTPGSYLADRSSTLNTVDLADGKQAFSSQSTGALNNARWYSTGVPLPTGEVIAFSGADRDEVVAPGSGAPILQAEIYNPATKTWSKLAQGKQGRTYHNTAALLPDGRIMVAGHSPINRSYGAQSESAGTSKGSRDPTIEIFSPPYLFRGPRPEIRSLSGPLSYGRAVRIDMSYSRDIENVVLMRNTAVTHLVDGDQRTVVLPILRRDDRSVTVVMPNSAAVLPAGPYQLFANRRSAKGLIPSVSRQVSLGGRTAGNPVPLPTTEEASASRGGAANRPANRSASAGRASGASLAATGGFPLAALAAAVLLSGAAGGLVVRRVRTR